MKADEIHHMRDDELSEEAERMRRRLYELRSLAVTDTLDNPRQIRQLRRDLARLLTEQRQRELRAEHQASPQATAS